MEKEKEQLNKKAANEVAEKEQNITIQHKQQLEKEKKSLKQSLTQQINFEQESIYMAREKAQFRKLDQELTQARQKSAAQIESEYKEKLDEKQKEMVK